MKILLLVSLLSTTLPQPEGWPPLRNYDLGSRDGSSFGALERELLPAAQDAANILDIWILPAIYLQYGSGGHSQLEEMRYSAYGRSWRSNHTYIDEIDVTDPFAEGQPMITPPWGLWSQYRFAGLRNTYGEQLGTTYVLSQPRNLGFKGTVESSFINETGGATLIPPHTLDGEPGTLRGATTARREIAKNYYLGGTAVYCGQKFCNWVGVDYQKLDRTFITHDVLDEGSRLRVATGFEAEVKKHKLSGRFMYEGLDISAFGGEYRLLYDDLARQKNNAFHGQFGWDYRGWQLRAGYTHKITSSDPYGAVEKTEITEWRADSFSLPAYGRSARGLFQLSFNYRRGPNGWFNTFLVDGVDYRPENRQHLYSYLGQGQWVEQFAGNDLLTYRRERLRTWYKYERDFEKINVKALFGLYLQLNQIQGDDTLFNKLAPYGQVDAIFKFTPKLFASLGGLTDVPDLPYQFMLFANSALAHSSRYFWFDRNGDGRFSDDEFGTLVRQGGGDTHSLADNLQPAREWELFIGMGGTNGRRFHWRFNVIERFYTGRYMVMYDQASQDLWHSVAVKDPMGTGRGAELSLSGEGQDLTAFIKDTALWGRDKYVLQNDSRMALYQGIELQLYSAGKIGFFHLSGTAYWVEGFAPYGNGPAYNDFLAIDEESADPNWQQNEKGRLDGCHALGLNITWGIRLFGSARYGSLYFASATRYRDGEPFARLYVADNLPQGAMPIQANWRAGVRYTYNMSCDLRLVYRLPLGLTTLWIYADIYNLLDSTAEISEYAYTGGNFRQALESIPPRTFMLKLKIALGNNQ